MNVAVETTCAEFDHRSAEQVRGIIKLYEAYLLEEMDRTGESPAGFPVALYLKTYVLWCGNEIAGFCSLDLCRHCVELIYIDPKYRGHGIARVVFAQLKASCPAPMRAKAPLTPAGRALVESVDVGISEPDEEEVVKAENFQKDLRRRIKESCTHAGRGNPRRPCPRCYRKTARRMAALLVIDYVAACVRLSA